MTIKKENLQCDVGNERVNQLLHPCSSLVQGILFLNVVLLFLAFRALSHCEASLFNKLVGIQPELAFHERALDGLIDLLRKDQVR